MLSRIQPHLHLLARCDAARSFVSVTFPFDQPPGPGRLTEVAPGVHWLRLPLPFRLDHVNIYLIENGAALDRGRYRPGDR